MKSVSTLLAIAVIIIAIAASGITNGSIIIYEEASGTGCEMEFKEWSSQNKCELTLSKGDEILIEVICETGSVELDVISKSGAEAYSGNGIEASRFTVKATQGGDYIFSIKGDKATGKVYIKNIADKS